MTHTEVRIFQIALRDGNGRGNGKTLSKLKTHFIKAKNTLCKY